MRLLIAEDELDLAEALTVFFEKNHFTVDAVHNGFDAYEYAAAGGYDKHDRDKAPTDGGPGGKGGGAATTSIKPTLADVTVTYSASSDRDGAMVYSASGTANVQQNATLALTPIRRGRACSLR